jgi:ubiquinol oxidase
MVPVTSSLFAGSPDFQRGVTVAKYGLAARALFALLDSVYGREISKFKVLELLARVPYQSWEQVGYIAITHTYERTGLARQIY